MKIFYEVYSKSLETESVFSKTEMIIETLFFFRIDTFNTLIPVSSPFVKAHLKLFILYSVKLCCCISFNVLHFHKFLDDFSVKKKRLSCSKLGLVKLLHFPNPVFY